MALESYKYTARRHDVDQNDYRTLSHRQVVAQETKRHEDRPSLAAVGLRHVNTPAKLFPQTGISTAQLLRR